MAQNSIYISELQAAICTINSVDSSFVRRMLLKGNNVLFYNNGKEVRFGVDNSYRLQIKNENIYTKKFVIERLNRNIQLILDEYKLK